MRTRSLAAGMPLPSYSYKAPYVVLSLYREAEAAIPDRGVDILGQLSASEISGWKWLATRETVTTAEYQEAMNVSDRTARYHLKRLAKLKLLRVVGAGRATRYEVIRS